MAHSTTGRLLFSPDHCPSRLCLECELISALLTQRHRPAEPSRSPPPPRPHPAPSLDPLPSTCRPLVAAPTLPTDQLAAETVRERRIKFQGRHWRRSCAGRGLRAAEARRRRMRMKGRRRRRRSGLGGSVDRWQPRALWPPPQSLAKTSLMSLGQSTATTRARISLGEAIT